MFTQPDRSFAVYRAVVHSNNPLTGEVRVLVPSVAGRDHSIQVEKAGLPRADDDTFLVPETGAVVFVYANPDFTQVYWPQGISGDAVLEGAMAGHESAPDPHAQYLLQAEGDARYLDQTEGDARYLQVAGGDARYLQLTGGTLTGATSLTAAPTGPNDLVRLGDMDPAPRGIVAYAQRLTNAGAFSTNTDIAGVSITWNAVAGRYYRIFIQAVAISNTSNGAAKLRITRSTGVVVAEVEQQLTQAVGFGTTMHGEAVLTGLSGAVTFKMQGESISGLTTLVSGTTRPTFIYAQDLGYF